MNIVNDLTSINENDIIQDIKHIVKKEGNDLRVYQYTPAVGKFIAEKLTNVKRFFRKFSKQQSNRKQHFDLKKIITGAEDDGLSSLQIDDEYKYIIKHVLHDNLPTYLTQIHGTTRANLTSSIQQQSK